MTDIVKFVFIEDEELPLPHASSQVFYIEIDPGDQEIDYASIEDAISSYIGAGCDDSTCFALIEDVIGSFGFEDYSVYSDKAYMDIITRRQNQEPSYVFMI